MEEAKKQNKTKILIIEDDAFIMDMYCTKFEMTGYKVLKADDGIKGIKIINENKPDVVVLDIIMPRMDGFGVLRMIKKDPKLQDIPVILLTNLGQKENIEEGLELKADDYIIKAHFTPDEVVSRVEKVLKNRITNNK